MAVSGKAEELPSNLPNFNFEKIQFLDLASNDFKTSLLGKSEKDCLKDKLSEEISQQQFELMVLQKNKENLKKEIAALQEDRKREHNLRRTVWRPFVPLQGNDILITDILPAQQDSKASKETKESSEEIVKKLEEENKAVTERAEKLEAEIKEITEDLKSIKMRSSSTELSLISLINNLALTNGGIDCQHITVNEAVQLTQKSIIEMQQKIENQEDKNMNLYMKLKQTEKSLKESNSQIEVLRMEHVQREVFHELKEVLSQRKTKSNCQNEYVHSLEERIQLLKEDLQEERNVKESEKEKLKRLEKYVEKLQINQEKTLLKICVLECETERLRSYLSNFVRKHKAKKKQ